MSIFDDIKKAFRPVEQAVQGFNPDAVAQAIVNHIEQPVKAKLPGHLSLGEAKELLEIAQPDAIDVDVFVGFGLSLGIELELEFGMGITIEQPAGKVGHLIGLVENPPETVHQLCDRLWQIAPTEVRVHETLQASIGETGQLRWYGEGVMERVVAYITDRGWMERRLRP